MKYFYPKALVAPILFFVIALSGCFKDNISKKYTIYTPVMKNKMEVLADLKNDEPQPLSSPGKIFMYGTFIFVNEMNRGVHVLDNSDPKSPKAIAFIPIPGNLDIAVKGNILYADMYSDLIVMDISDPLQAKFLKNFTHVFPERNYGAGWVADSTMVVVGWITKDTIVNVDESPQWWVDYPAFAVQDAMRSNSGGKTSVSVPGLAGSMARLSVVNDYLYAVNNLALGVFDIHDIRQPEFKGMRPVEWGIETIYPFKDRLFIGSTTGMFVFNIDNPEEPVREASFAHARSCDPVVADDTYAYVTLRSGNTCNGFSNQLDVIDVTDIDQPRLVKSYEMSNPHGLAIDGKTLFICEGEDGLKIFDATDVNELRLLKHIKDVNAYDVIAWNRRLLMVGSGGLYQYDYSNPAQMELLSVIKTSPAR